MDVDQYLMTYYCLRHRGEKFHVQPFFPEKYRGPQNRSRRTSTYKRIAEHYRLREGDDGTVLEHGEKEKRFDCSEVRDGEGLPFLIFSFLFFLLFSILSVLS